MAKNDLITDLRNIRISGYSFLSVKGKALYRQKCLELIKRGELLQTHLPSLILWADCYDRYWTLRSEIDAEGSTFETSNKFGQPVISANPKVKMMMDALKQSQAIMAEFGGTLKQSRKIGGKTDKDPLDGWID